MTGAANGRPAAGGGVGVGAAVGTAGMIRIPTAATVTRDQRVAQKMRGRRGCRNAINIEATRRSRAVPSRLSRGAPAGVRF